MLISMRADVQPPPQHYGARALLFVCCCKLHTIAIANMAEPIARAARVERGECQTAAAASALIAFAINDHAQKSTGA